MNNIKELRIVAITLLVAGIGMMSFTLSKKESEFKVRTDKSTIEWRAYKTGGEHRGEVKVKSGSFSLDGVLVTSGEFVVDMTTIKVIDTESKKLHNHLHSTDFFNTKEFPEAKLVITGSKQIDDKNIEVTGDLTIIGKTNPINFNAKVAAHTADVIIYDADIKVDRTKYGITYRSSLGDAFIMDEFDLKVKLVGVRSKS